VAVYFRRRLPHYHSVGNPVFLTWRLHGSLPVHRSFSSGIPSGRAFLAMDRILDRGQSGPLFLSRPEVATLIIEALAYRASILKHYDLHAWVVMPNHVHVLMTPQIPVSKLMHSLKRYTAAQANRILNRVGYSFWQDESYDRLVRNQEEFYKIARYIEMNPVAAGLSPTAEDFCWSSAGRFGPTLQAG
jgi:REP element-mobilizing transposase RayT